MALAAATGAMDANRKTYRANSRGPAAARRVLEIDESPLVLSS
jgi:hypothetical protein